MRCARIQKLLQSYVDGAAGRAERQRVEAHLASCAACARALEECRRLVAALSDMPVRRVGPGFEARVREGTRAAVPRSLAAAWWERCRLHWDWRLQTPARALAGVAAALVVAWSAPRIAEVQARKREQSRYVAAVVERHRQLERASRSVDWDAVDTSIELSTGSILTE